MNRVYGGPPHQVIDGRFMDPAKLVNVLRSEYGQSNFRVELRLDQYKIYVFDQAMAQSSGLTQEKIKYCQLFG
ncbi:hypothetical protein BDW42DRAFT_165247 [Aspergillus taichungensis]|uniref:Uncharacterized protein n=1 Tax=Aspergillus taichungensis TaxID=482145 RepID=A0A2J5I0B2_9EURO|nr:hypothetical protein BDW42DRAFT_165247 [Aspergillus taichungensis]